MAEENTPGENAGNFASDGEGAAGSAQQQPQPQADPAVLAIEQGLQKNQGTLFKVAQGILGRVRGAGDRVGLARADTMGLAKAVGLSQEALKICKEVDAGKRPHSDFGLAQKVTERGIWVLDGIMERWPNATTAVLPVKLKMLKQAEQIKAAIEEG